MELSISKINSYALILNFFFYISGNGNPKKTPYISENRIIL